MHYLIFVTLLATSVAASPAPGDGRATNVCNKAPINVISGILKALKATAFCSDYIHITPSTKTISQVQTSVTSYTSTTTDTQYVDSVTSTLLLQSTDITTTTGTSYVQVTNTISTTITAVLSTSTSTDFLTVSANAATPTSTRTITSTIFSYYARQKRDLEERKLPFPTELIKMAASDISQGCSCLGLPTPTVTSTAFVTSTVLALSTATTVSTRISIASATTIITNYIEVLDVESTTITIGLTSTIPSIAISTITSTSTSTFTPAAFTTTVLASTTIATDPCNPTSGTKYADEVYNFSGIFHNGYDPALSILTFGNIPLSDCCRKCFQTPGCAVATMLIGGSGCFVLVNAVKPVLGQSGTCPTGLDFIDTFTGSSKGLPAAQDGTFVVGPCFAGNLRN